MRSSTTAFRHTHLPHCNVQALACPLQAKGLGKATPRKHWPAELLQKVMGDLAANIPASLLADQLWISSGTFADWWSRQQRYSRSLAFMSMVCQRLQDPKTTCMPAAAVLRMGGRLRHIVWQGSMSNHCLADTCRHHSKISSVACRCNGRCTKPSP